MSVGQGPMVTLLPCSLHTQLHGLCWSLRNSQQRRVALDKEMRWKAFPSFTSQPGNDKQLQPWEASLCGPRSWGSCPKHLLPHHPYPQTHLDRTTSIVRFLPTKMLLGLFAHMESVRPGGPWRGGKGRRD
jgi:hypothetical protein